ncbi:MAG: FRG domain-containing protein [Phycisphaeraceae bacterium]|nr:FRG domain-containing protein [Phycisphaeraceae bacterium]
MDGMSGRGYSGEDSAAWSEEQPETLAELLRYLENLGAHGGQYWFRGESQDFPSRQSRLAVNHPNASHAELFELELELVREFWRIAHLHLRGLLPHLQQPELRGIHQCLEVMPLARHYGIPTRLVDWTTHWYVAAFVAAVDDPAKPGYVYALNAAELAVAVHARWDGLGIGSCPYGSGQRAWVEALERPMPPPFLIQWHYPPRLRRMHSQGAKFLLHSCANMPHDPAIFDLLKHAEGQFKHLRIRVNAGLKDELLRYLGQFEVNADALGFTSLDRACWEMVASHQKDHGNR